MALTYSAGDGARVTSYALSISDDLPAQTQNTGNNQITFEDNVDVTTSSPDPVQTTGGDINSAVYTGRIIILRRGTGTEEIRRAVSETAGSGTTVIVTVNADWDSDPASGDIADVFYTIDDLAAAAGQGVNLNSKSGAYEIQRILTIGQSAGGDAGLQLVDSEYVECADRGTSLSLLIEPDGFLIMGFEEDGNSQSGAIITQTANGGTDVWAQINSGGRWELYDSIVWSQRSALPVNFLNGSNAKIRNSKIISGTRELQLFDADVQALGVAGRDGTTELVRVDAGTVVNGMTITNTAGLGTSGTATETLTLNDVAFISNTDGTNEAFIAVDSNKTWDMIDPTWNVTTIGDFNWVTTTSNRVNERRSIDATVQDKAGAALNLAQFVVYYETDDTVPATENLTSFESNASGLVDGNWLYKQYITNSSTITSSAGAVRVDKYTYSPFAAAQSITTRFSGAVTLIEDDEITQSDPLLALSLSATPVTITRDTTNGHSLVKFTGGSGTLSGTITANGGAAGTFLNIVEGDSTAGWVLIDRTNTTAYVSNESLSNGAGWTATIDGTVAVAVRQYTVVIDANSETLSELYDYLAAISSSAIDDVNYGTDSTTIQKWGRGNQPRLLIKAGTTYNTLRSGTEGVLVYDYGVGNVSSFQDDDGNFYSPPASYQLELTGIKDTTEIRIHRDTDGVQLAGVESVDAGVGSQATAGVSIGGTADNNTFTYQYTYGGSDVDIYIVIISLAYEYERLDTVVLSNSNQSIPVQQRIDRNYFNP